MSLVRLQRAALVLEHRVELSNAEVERRSRNVRDSAQTRWHSHGAELVQQTQHVTCSSIVGQLAILDLAESTKTIEVVDTDVAAKELGGLQVHGQNLPCHVTVGVGLDAAEPVFRNTLWDVCPAAGGVGVFYGAEEALHGGEIGDALVAVGWEKLVEERCGAVK